MDDLQEILDQQASDKGNDTQVAAPGLVDDDDDGDIAAVDPKTAGDVSDAFYDDQPKDEEPAAKGQEPKAGWDKDRQQIQQDAAAAKKTADRLSGQVEVLTSQSAAYSEKIAELTAKLETAKTATPEDKGIELDEDVHGADLVAAVKGLEKQLAEAKAASQATENKLKAAEATEARKAQDAKIAQHREKLLSRFDKKYGAKFRNAAVEAANAEVRETGIVPADDVDRIELLEKHYEALSATAKAKKTTKTVRQDSRGGGVTLAAPSKATGTLEEVRTAMRREGKFSGGTTFPGG